MTKVLTHGGKTIGYDGVRKVLPYQSGLQAFRVVRTRRNTTPMITDAAFDRVKPIEVVCKYCDALAGEKCTRWRRTKRGKVKQVRSSPHPDRVHSAKLVSKALDALDPL